MEKRRDNKGRILKTGESQRKDGRYAYKYTDVVGEPPKFAYAWKLVPTDKTPAGKREDLSLREKIKEIQKDLEDGIDTIGKKMTVCQLYALQNKHRQNIRRKTQKGREHLMGILENDPLGKRSIDSVKLSDGKEWALRMKEKGYAFKTISNYKRSLKASFYTAIDNDCIRKNPFNYQLSTVLKDDTKPKVALTKEQEVNLLTFAKSDKSYQKYCDAMTVLLGTGLRISELCGLTMSDLDFRKRIISIDHQLLNETGVGYYIEQPKTENGIRQLPMTEDVFQALKRVIKNRKDAEPIVVDGYRDFLFLNSKGLPMLGGNYTSAFKGLVNKYNKCQKDTLPHVTPHTFRHTFCTYLANKGMNPKSLQYLMGHANITLTLNYYAHASFDSAQAEMTRLVA